MDDPTRNALRVLTTSPLNIFREAMKAVPQLKFGLGIIGLIALIVFAGSYLKVSFRVAVIGVLIMIILMVLLVIFAALTKASGALRVAAIIMMFAFLLLGISTGVCIFTSVFFKSPVDLQDWIKDPTPTASPTPTPTPSPSPKDSASIVLKEGRTLQSAIDDLALLDDFRAQVTNCSRPFLQSKIRGGLARAETMEKLIEQLQFRINKPPTRERYTVTRKDQEKTYAVQCTKS